MYIYTAKHKDLGIIGGIVEGRNSTEGYTNAQKEIARRGGNIKEIQFTSL